MGLILLLVYRKDKKYHQIGEARMYYTNEMPTGISLGNYIIMNTDDKKEGLHHEYGHHIQSLILGPIYLIIIGLPSLTGNIFDRLFHSKWELRKAVAWYYHQPWEYWADILGKVDRNKLIGKWANWLESHKNDVMPGR